MKGPDQVFITIGRDGWAWVGDGLRSRRVRRQCARGDVVDLMMRFAVFQLPSFGYCVSCVEVVEVAVEFAVK